MEGNFVNNFKIYLFVLMKVTKTGSDRLKTPNAHARLLERPLLLYRCFTNESIETRYLNCIFKVIMLVYILQDLYSLLPWVVD